LTAGSRRNLLLVGINRLKEHIMSQIHLVARLAQGLLAVTVVFAIGLVVQLSLVY